MPSTQRTEEPSKEEGFLGYSHLFIQQILSAYYMPGTENSAVNTVGGPDPCLGPSRERVTKINSHTNNVNLGP